MKPHVRTFAFSLLIGTFGGLLAGCKGDSEVGGKVEAPGYYNGEMQPKGKPDVATPGGKAPASDAANK